MRGRTNKILILVVKDGFPSFIIIFGRIFSFCFAHYFLKIDQVNKEKILTLAIKLLKAHMFIIIRYLFREVWQKVTVMIHLSCF